MINPMEVKVAKALSELPSANISDIYRYAFRRWRALPVIDPDWLYYLEMMNRALAELQLRAQEAA